MIVGVRSPATEALSKGLSSIQKTLVFYLTPQKYWITRDPSLKNRFR